MRALRIAAIVLAVSVWLPLRSGAEHSPEHETLVVEGSDDLESERDQSNEQALEAIRRTPGGVALMPEDLIERTRAASFEDVLESVPGVYVRARGTGEEPQISIRGSGLRNNFHTRGVNVLIDGFPFQNADGFSDVESFEFLAARRVEVYKGANSLRFGGNALGGAINIVTQTGRDAAPLRLRSEGGAFGFWKSYGSGAYDAGPWDAFLALSHTQQDGYRDHAEQDRQRAYGSLGRGFDGGAALRVDLNAVRNRQELPGALGHGELHADPRESNLASELQDERRDFDFGRGAVTLSLPVSDELRVDWQSQTSFEELDHPLAFGIIDNETWNAGTELRTVAEHPVFGLDSRFDAGVQLAYTRQPQTIFANQGGHRGASFDRQLGQAANAALYFSEDLALGDAVSLVGGTRAQWAWRRVRDKDGGRERLGRVLVRGALARRDLARRSRCRAVRKRRLCVRARRAVRADRARQRHRRARPRGARPAARVAVRGRGARRRRRAALVRRRGVRHRAARRDPQRQVLPFRARRSRSRPTEHRPLAPLGRRGRARSPDCARPRRAVGCRGRRRAARADVLHLLALRIRARRSSATTTCPARRATSRPPRCAGSTARGSGSRRSSSGWAIAGSSTART